MQELNLIGVLSTGGSGRLPVIEAKTITANGTYTAPEGVDGYSPVTVNVPASQPVIEPKTITANGTYTAPEGVDGFNPVVVDVPSKEEITLYANQNRTYTPDEGKVYNNVVVNVPLPQNAYLLKSVANLPQAIASFNDGEDMVMSSLKVAIEPQQEGSGDPSPTNIRPISGWSAVDVTVADDVETPTLSNVYTIELDGTRYGGEVDVVSGVLTMDRTYYKYTNVSTTSGIAVTDGWRCNFTCPIDDINRGKWSIQTDATPIFNKISIVAKGYGANEYTVILPNVTSKEEADAMLEGLEICYKLVTPQTIQLTPTAVKSLLGSNNVWADTGDITDAEYFSKDI